MSCVVVSLMPSQSLPGGVFSIWDKAQHIGAFMVLSTVGVWAYPKLRHHVFYSLLVLGGGIKVAEVAIGWRHG